MSMTQTIQQRSPEWFAQRKGKITGSIAGAILGLNPYMTPNAAMRRMVRDALGLDSEFVGNVATEYGKNHENLAMLAYWQKTGNLVNECGFYVCHDYNWLGASPDGIIELSEGGHATLEIKCPYSLRNSPLPEFKSLENQPHYYAQVQIEMLCTGITKTHFYQWNQYADSLEVVSYNQDWIDENIPKLFEFYERFMIEIKNPIHAAPLIKELNNDKALSLLAEYDQLSTVIDESTSRKAEVLAELVAMANNQNSVIHGRKLTQISKAGAISYAKAIKDLLPDADLSKYQGKPSTYWKLS